MGLGSGAIQVLVGQVRVPLRDRLLRVIEVAADCPVSRSLDGAGPTRKVPGRNGMSYTEEDWVDEDVTAHRIDDE